LEITEEALADSQTIIAALTVLAAMDVRLAIDDFSMGCSSLAYLRTMRVNRIKIDQSFVTGFKDRPGDQILVKAILGIGRSLGIDVLAEGVETAEEAVLLRAFGCHVVQGFYFGRPMRDEALDAWMAEHAGIGSARSWNDEAPAARPPLAIAVA
jgi:EAL domain-containing protein (putative c-di-GMP-specific phosphodiesterase class I)